MDDAYAALTAFLGQLRLAIRRVPLLREWPLRVDGIPVGGLDQRPAFLPIEGHSITIGAPGEGKFTSVIAPLALHDVRDGDGLACGMVFLDVKNGEAARVTRPFRELLREEMTFVLDPYGLAGGSDTINPFDFVDPTAADFYEQCDALANALVVQRPKDKRGNDFIWDARGAEWLTTVIAYLVRERGEERTIMRLREIFSLEPDEFAEILKKMRAQRDAPRFIARSARDMARVTGKAEREASGYIATIMQATKFADSEIMAKALSDSTFDPIVVRTFGASVYIVTPDHNLPTCSPWVRLVSEVIRQRIMRSQSRRQVHWVVDEAKAFDAWNFIEDGLRALRSANISLHLFYQNVGQIKSVWGEGWSSLTDVKMIRFLGSSDVETCRWISELAGETTVVDYSRADNRGQSRSTAQGTTESSGTSASRALGHGQTWNASEGESEAAGASRARGFSTTRTTQTGTSKAKADAVGSSFTFGESKSRSRSTTLTTGSSDASNSSMSAGYSTGPGGTSGTFSSGFGGGHTESSSLSIGFANSNTFSSTHGFSNTTTHTDSKSASNSSAAGFSTTNTDSKTKTISRNTGHGGSDSTTNTKGETTSQGRSRTATDGESVGVTITQTERRRLLTIDEVRRLDPTKMIVFIGRQHAHLIDRLHHFESPRLMERVTLGRLAQLRRRQGL